MADRAALEEQMTVEERRAAYEMARSAGIPSLRWHLAPGIARPWEALAVTRLQDSLAQSLGLAPSTALTLAAIRLGVDEQTHRSRLRRWAAAAA